MFAFDPSETPYDLRFRVLGVPVRVHPMFWLVNVLIGGETARRGLEFLAIWIGCVFVSILVHELGHAFMGMNFGAYGHVVLYGFGGLAIGSNRLASRPQRIAVCFAGPAAGFLFLAGILGALRLHDPDAFAGYVSLTLAHLGIAYDTTALRFLDFGSIGTAIVNDLIFINLVWGLINLLPIWPLDGGQIARDVITGFSPDKGLIQSLGLSLATASTIAVHSIMAVLGKPLLPLPIGSPFSSMFFGMFALQSYQLILQAQAQRRWMDDHWDQHAR